MSNNIIPAEILSVNHDNDDHDNDHDHHYHDNYNNEQTNCIICFEEYDTNKQRTFLECSHSFCNECITKFKCSNIFECPKCRYAINYNLLGLNSPTRNITQEVHGDYLRLYTPSNTPINTPSNSPNLTHVSVNSRTQMVNNPPRENNVSEKSCCEKTCNCISKHCDNNKCKYTTCLFASFIVCLCLQP